MIDVDRAAAEKGTAAVLEAAGIKGVSAGELEMIAEAVVGLVKVLDGSRKKRAAQAGLEAAAKITDDEKAEEAARNRR